MSYGTLIMPSLSEERIEQLAESEMNILDRLLLRGALTQEQYDVEVSKLDKWAQAQYDAR